MRLRTTAVAASCLALALGAALLAGPSAAGSVLPRHAVAVLASKTSVDTAGYEAVRVACSSCLSKPGYTATNWAVPDPYQLGTDPSGDLVVASLVRQGVVKVTRFDPQTFATVSTGQLSLNSSHFTLETVYLAPNGELYALLARNAANKSQSASFVVGKVRRFGPDLTPLGTAKITSEAADSYGVWRLARWGASSMLLSGTTLVLHTSRTIYADSAGIHHEVSLTVAVDTATMTLVPKTGDFSWVSHSFNQLIGQSGDSLVLVDHGDAYPRAVTLTVVSSYWSTLQVGTPQVYDPVKIQGSLGDNFTGITANSLQVGSGRVLVAGISVPDNHPIDGIGGVSSTYSPNVYVVSTDLATGSKRYHWLTRFSPTASPRKWVGQPAIVKLGPRRFAVLYSVVSPTSHFMHYALVNARGKELAHRAWKRFGFNALGPPLRIGNRVFWVGFHSKAGSTTGRHLLYALDVIDPTAPVFAQ